MSTDHYLTAAAMFQNEAPYLDEWLAFHVAEGVEHFLLYDNRSTDGWRDVLAPWLRAGLVTVIDWPIRYEDGAQPQAFDDALARLRERSRWIAFIDIDEFLFSPGGTSVAAVMRDFEGAAGVVVNWQCYGSSGLTAQPTGFAIESYVRRAPTQWVRNRRVKSIVDPRVAVHAIGPHLFGYRDGRLPVTEHGEPVQATRAPRWRGRWRRRLRHLAGKLPLLLPIDAYSINESSIRRVSVERLRINHYVTRSAAEIAAKYKDRAVLAKGGDQRTFFRYHDRNEVHDPILASRAGQLRAVLERLGIGPVD